jgi:predicted Zn-dependent protease
MIILHMPLVKECDHPAFGTPQRSAVLLRRAALTGMAAALIAVVSGCRASSDEKLSKAQALLDEGRVREAIERAREIIDEEPRHARANLLLGQSLLLDGRATLAVWPLEIAAGDAKLAVEGGVLLAAALLDSGNAEEAVRAADAVLAREPGDVVARELSARAHLAAGPC